MDIRLFHSEMMGMELLKMSFCAGVMIVAVMTVRAVFLNRLPKRTFLVLWGVVFLRLLLPFSFPSTLSVYTLFGQMGEEELPENLQWAANMLWRAELIGGQGSGEHDLSEAAVLDQNPAQGPGESYSQGREVPSSKNWGGYAAGILWGAGALLCAVFFGAAYFRSLLEFRMAIPLEDEGVGRWRQGLRIRRRILVRQSDRISIPLTYGIFRPVILVPKSLALGDPGDLEYVLQHEYVHIRHCDAALKLVMTAALCIHWFNPLVWAMSAFFGRDIELACDEGVLHRFGEKSRSAYAMVLIGMEEKKCGFMPLYNGFSKNAAEERIRSIMKYRRAGVAAIGAAVMLTLMVSVVFATSAWEAEDGGRVGGDMQNLSDRDALGIPTDPPVNGAIYGSEDLQNTVPVPGSGQDAVSVPEGGQDIVPVPGDGQGFVPVPENGYAVSYMQEGERQDEPADLYMGENYYVLIPSEGFSVSGQNSWVWENNDKVQFWVEDLYGSTKEQALEQLEAQGYVSAEDHEDKMEKSSQGLLYCAEVRAGGRELWSIHYTCPDDAEYIEGIGRLLNAMCENFGIVPRDGEMSEEAQAVRALALDFWEAYLAGDEERMRGYLAEADETPLESFPDGVDGHVAAQARVMSVKGLENAEGKLLGERCELWVEFLPNEGADSLEYLTLGCVKGQAGWKVEFYGLEM